MEGFGFVELVCFIGNRLYTSKLTKADFKSMLLENLSDSEDDSDDDPKMNDFLNDMNITVN